MYFYMITCLYRAFYANIFAFHMFFNVLSSPPLMSWKFDACVVIVHDGLNAVSRILLTLPEATGLTYGAVCEFLLSVLLSCQLGVFNTIQSLFLLVLYVWVLFVVQDKIYILQHLSWKFMLFPYILVICFALWCPVQFPYKNNTCRRGHMSCLCYYL